LSDEGFHSVGSSAPEFPWQVGDNQICEACIIDALRGVVRDQDDIEVAGQAAHELANENLHSAGLCERIFHADGDPGHFRKAEKLKSCS